MPLPGSEGRRFPSAIPVPTAQSYNAVVEHGVQANGAVAYHWESQLEFSYMMLEYHRFFGADILPYLPMIRQSVRFFDEHYQAYERLRSGRPLDENGRLVIYPSTSCESYRGARNPADLIAGLSACLQSLLALDDSLVSPGDKAYYRAYLKRLPAYTYATVDGDRIFQPAASWKRYQNVECPQFYPLFPFNRFALGRDDINVFRNTWKHGTFPKNMVQSWHQDGIFFAHGADVRRGGLQRPQTGKQSSPVSDVLGARPRLGARPQLGRQRHDRFAGDADADRGPADRPFAGMARRLGLRFQVACSLPNGR